MSIEKNVYEALRWLRTGEDDLDAASVLRENKKFPHACFHAQQAGEKALKAVWHYADADPWGHSIRKLVEDLENVDLSLYDRLKSLLRAGTMLVIQCDALNDSKLDAVVMLAITSNLKFGEVPGNVLLAKGEANMPKRCVINVTQLKSVDKSSLVEKIGSLPRKKMEQVVAGRNS
ncbi:MAG: HEPN domain-containing protein [Desulfatiglandales bacterium]